MSVILAIDPGTVQSAWVVLEDSRPSAFRIEPNAELIDRLRGWHDWARVGEAPFLTVAVIEKIESYGMAVGAEVFETVHWSGRFEEALYPSTPVVRLPRRVVKLHLCNDSRAKDANIRQALLDKFGGKSATGTKKAPGPLLRHPRGSLGGARRGNHVRRDAAMKRAYIAHALSGDWAGGVAAAKGYAYAAARAGYMPVAPYVLMDGILDDTDPEERALGMKLDLDQLRHCDEIWLCGERVSAGMHAEVDVAIDLDLVVRRFASLDDAP